LVSESWPLVFIEDFVTNEENVKAVYPNAQCIPDVFGIQWEVNSGTIIQNSFFGPLPQIMSTSTISIDEAWEYAWKNIQEQMIRKLES
jgi:hypothetical protein